MNRLTLINQLIQANGYSRYLEIGTGQQGFVINNIICDYKDGIDPGVAGQYITNDEVRIGEYPDHVNYPITSDQFFEGPAQQLEDYDIIFIDGLHESHQVDKDIQNALNKLKPGGTIILHDCNPIKEEEQEVPRVRPGRWNGDVWKSIVRYRFSQPTLGCMVINTDEGLGVISSQVPAGTTFEMPDQLTYQWLEENRHVALQLVSVDVGSYLLQL